jgi:hypothetical protein
LGNLRQAIQELATENQALLDDVRDLLARKHLPDHHRDMLRDAESALIQSLDGVHKIQRAIPAARSTTPAG